MPWFPELSTAQARVARERSAEQEPDVIRTDFFDGILNREPEELAASFGGAPLLDDPRFGRVDGEQAFVSYAQDVRGWLEQEGGITDAIGLTRTPNRFIEEVSVRLRGVHPELPVAIATDIDEAGRIQFIRVYHSTWPLTGTHQVRAPVLPTNPDLQMTGSPADYQRALAAGDLEGVLDAYEPDATLREPSGGPYVFRGREQLRRIYSLQLANGGGIPLERATVTDDGTAAVLEYNARSWGRDAIPSQAGLAVYIRGKSGRLAAGRIYDDITPPATSDSTGQATD